MKENATVAMILVNEAHDKLFKEGGTWLDRKINSLLDTMTKEKDDWEPFMEESSRREDEKEACRKAVRRKPWFWTYKTQKECEKDGDYFYGEFWATVGHSLSVYPRSFSDWVWDVVEKDWRYPAPAGPPLDILTFYGPCFQTYTVTLPVLSSKGQSGPPRWSSFRNTPCNTSLFAGDDFPLYDMVLLSFLTIFLLLASRNLFKRFIVYSFNLLFFGIMLNLWYILWTIRKVFSLIRRIFRNIFGKVEVILDETKRYLYGTRIVRLVFYLLELNQAWEEKGFSVREAWRNKGFSVSVETGRGGRRRRM